MTSAKESRSVNPTVRVLTLDVSDLPRSLAFYRDGLGLPTDGVIGGEFDHGAVVFIDMEHGLRCFTTPPTPPASASSRRPMRMTP
jgi:catechol 2,3-dioxygenase-like lactoylglutathione lyase family enzyme